MNKNSKYFIGIAVLFCIVGFLLLFVFQLIEYAIFAFILSFIGVFTGISSVVQNRSPEVAYASKIQKILNTFDSILVRSSTVPNLEGRNIIPIMTMDDLVDAQLEIRKPICYLKQTESCSFILLDEKEAYVYVEKLNDSVESPVEIAIRDLKVQNKSKEVMDSEMLRDIDKTTIVKLSNQKSYRVSPIRKNKKVEGTGMLEHTVDIPTITDNKFRFVDVTDMEII